MGPNHGACGTRAEERATNLVKEATVLLYNQNLFWRQTGHIDPTFLDVLLRAREASAMMPISAHCFAWQPPEKMVRKWVKCPCTL